MTLANYQGWPGLSCSVCGRPLRPTEMRYDFDGALVGPECYVGPPKRERGLTSITSPAPNAPNVIFGGTTRPSLRGMT